MLATPTLLITDDDAALRESLATAFTRRGFQVALAADGKHGLDLARTGGVHLALVDYQMPKLTGLEMLAQLREIRPELPCILMSAAMDETLRSEAARMRAYGVMSKPLRLSEIDKIVRQAMQKYYGWAADPR